MVVLLLQNRLEFPVLSKLLLPLSVTQPCLTLRTSMDGSLPDSSVRGILQARTLEWAAVLFSRASSQPRDWTCASCIDRRLLGH